MVQNADDLRSGMTGRGVSRRAVVKGAAWTVPAIVIATAAPAAATDSGTKFATSAQGKYKTSPAPAVLTFTVFFGGTSTGNHTVTIDSITSAGITYTIVGTNVFTIGTTNKITFTATPSSDPTGATAVISYTITGHGSGTIPAPIT